MAGKRAKYKWLDINTRQEIIGILKSNEEKGIKSNFTKIARQYHVSRATILRIRGSEKTLEKQLIQYAKMPCIKKRKKIPIMKNFLLEDILYEWFKQKRAAGLPVSGNVLKEKALLINTRIKGDIKFKASEGWLTGFKNRYQLRCCSTQEDKFPTDFESNVEFVNELASIIRLRNFQLYQIYNADETGLLWAKLPVPTFDAEYETDDRVTVVVCANADGTHKIPLFVIGKLKNPSGFNDFRQLPVTYEWQRNAWMTDELFRKWYSGVFLPSVRNYQAERGQSYKVLLILDNAKCHLSKEELNSFDDMCSVEFLPPSLNSLIQPMDQGVIEEMKKLFRKGFLQEMLLKENEQSLLDFIKKRNMKTCCTQLATAWSQITRMNIFRAWRKLIPGCDIELTEPDSSVSQDDFLQMLNRIPGFLETTCMQLSTWLEVDVNDSGWEKLSMEEILKRIEDAKIENCQIKTENIAAIINTPIKQEMKDEMEDEMEYEINEEDEPIDVKPVIIPDSITAEANSALDCFLKFRRWFEQRPECSPEHLITLQQLHELTSEIVSNTKHITTTENFLSVSYYTNSDICNNK